MKPTFTANLDLNLVPKLKKDLKTQGFNFTIPAYTLFSAQKNGIVCTVYKSGAIVVQGKNKNEFIEFYLEPEILKTFHYSNPESYIDMTPKIGTDEAGKGDFFGPLCVAGVYATKAEIKKLLKLNIQDSKKVSDNVVHKLAKEIRNGFTYSIVILHPTKYNELYKKFSNLNHLLGWAHARVIENLYSKTDCKNVLVDQFASKALLERLIQKRKLDLNLVQKTKAESDPVVAAASILARSYFLNALEKLGKEEGLTLLKGASAKVIELGIKIVNKFGKEKLLELGKVHFKTYEDILNQI